ncbi:MAG: patatin-like phospholipase family protein [Patescibacteria group bacterium]|nr:patatin-like phospholipase family protein [Patescibacteria group bacterium]
MTKKVGLALSGGGARGVAHIGVLKVLDGSGIPIDCIAGTSMGALVGAMYALDRNIDFVEKFFEEEGNWQSVLGLVDPTLRDGLIDAEKFRVWINDIFRGATFETLKIPLAVATTDLTTGEVVEITSGDVAMAVWASMAVPPTFKPIAYQEKVLADGWFSEPLPVGLARKMGAEVVVASMLSIGGMRRELDRKARNLVVDATTRGFNIMAHNLMLHEAAGADVLLWPQIKNIPFFSEASELAHSEMIADDIAAGVSEATARLGDITKAVGG